MKIHVVDVTGCNPRYFVSEYSAELFFNQRFVEFMKQDGARNHCVDYCDKEDYHDVTLAVFNKDTNDFDQVSIKRFSMDISGLDESVTVLKSSVDLLYRSINFDTFNCDNTERAKELIEEDIKSIKESYEDKKDFIIDEWVHPNIKHVHIDDPKLGTIISILYGIIKNQGV